MTRYIYKDFTGLYYAGGCAGWMNLGGSAWVKEPKRAMRLDAEQVERMKEYITGEGIEVD